MLLWPSDRLRHSNSVTHLGDDKLQSQDVLEIESSQECLEPSSHPVGAGAQVQVQTAIFESTPKTHSRSRSPRGAATGTKQLFMTRWLRSKPTLCDLSTPSASSETAARPNAPERVQDAFLTLRGSILKEMDSNTSMVSGTSNGIAEQKDNRASVVSAISTSTTKQKDCEDRDEDVDDLSLGAVVTMATRKSANTSLALTPAPGPPGVAVQGVVGPLHQLISKCTFAQHVLSEIETHGFKVLKGVLSYEETKVAYERMWEFVQRVNPQIQRSNPDTWYAKGRDDPWPHNARDMMQLHQAGWIFGDLREALASRVFEQLYGTQELHCSKDGFTFQRPTRTPLRRHPNEHVDQGSNRVGLHCIQGSVALLDQEIDDGCFLCYPGSHRHHTTITAHGVSRDWYVLSDDNKKTLEAAGCKPMRVPVSRGDVVLFRSDLVHAGASPLGIRKNFRAVVYVCMLPASLTPASLYPKKREAYERLATGSHWPTKEEWFGGNRWRSPSFVPQKFFEQPPVLNQRQKQLYGLVRYGE